MAVEPATVDRVALTPISYARPATNSPAASGRPPSVSRVRPDTGFAEPYAGAPYQVDGRWFVPAHEPNYDEVGVASWYGPGFDGKATASGEIYDQNALTAAHPTLPIPSLVKVTNLGNGRSLIVRLNDRGPYKNDRIIDLSRGAAEKLGVLATGTAKVQVQYVGPAPIAPNTVPEAKTQTSIPIGGDDRTESPPASRIDLRTPVRGPISPPEAAPAVRTDPLPPIVSLPPGGAPLQPGGPAGAPMPAATAAGASSYYLQAGAFADLGNAHRLRERLATFGPVEVTAVQSPKGELYRVMVGPWSDTQSRDQAQQAMDRAGVRAVALAAR